MTTISAGIPHPSSGTPAPLTLLANAFIRSMDAVDTVAEAVLMHGGRIEAVGRESDLLPQIGTSTVVIDLHGRTVIPGFIDAHNHFARAAFHPIQVDCSTPPLASVMTVLARISEHAANATPGRWVRAWGFHWSRVVEKRNPTLAELDAVSPGNPCVLIDASYHGCFTNSSALALAGIDRHSPAGRAGILVLDRNGDPTGELLESAMNGPEALSWEDAIGTDPSAALDLLDAHGRRHLALGITAASDALVTPTSAALYQSAADADRLPVTIQQMFGGRQFFEPPDPWTQAGAMKSARSPRLLGGSMKLFMDAVHPSPAIDRPFDGRPDAHTGVNYYGRGEAYEMVREATGAGLSVAIHALGNCAVDQALDVFARVRAVEPEARLRIEHFVLAGDTQARRARDLGVMVVTNPGFIDTWGDQYLERWRFDGREDLRVIPIRTLLEAGVTVAAASDHPCDDLNPFHGIWAAVARRSWTGDLLYADEAITPLEALRMYTQSAAIAEGRGAEEGSIEVGKKANLAVLDRDPVTCSLDELRDVAVVATYVDGARVYETPQPERLA